MIEFLPLFKALHIIGFVAWFAGMFYLARIFVYHREALDKSEPDRSILISQFNIMQWRVYKIICNPGMMISWTFGLLMLYAYGIDWFSSQYWLHAKLVFLLFLTGYHLYNKRIILKLEKEEAVMSSERFRLYNEVPSVILLVVVLLAVYKNTLNYGVATLSVLAFVILLFIFTRIYKNFRERKIS